MAGLSSKAVNFGGSNNSYLYNAKELQAQEFGDGSGMQMYDYGARLQDPQIGRWHVPDEFSNEFSNESPYAYGGNNPISNVDVDGRFKYPAHLEKEYKEKYKRFTNYLSSGKIEKLLES